MGTIAGVALMLGLLPAPPAESRDVADGGGSAPVQEEPAVEPIVSGRYAKRALDDLRGIAAAPARWDKDEWLRVGFATGAVAGTAWLLDEPIRHSIGHDPERAYGAIGTIERLGDARITLGLLGVFYGAGAVLDDDRAKAVALDGFIAQTIASALVTTTLKRAIGRGRPNLDRGSGHYGPFEGRASHSSFPSGHATVAFTVASVVANHYPETSWTRWGAYGLASVVAYARLKHDKHWASDVVGGALIGSGIGRAVVRMNREQRAGEGQKGFAIEPSEGGFAVAWHLFTAER
jgi:membrane-associated phospholipid phosphatase